MAQPDAQDMTAMPEGRPELDEAGELLESGKNLIRESYSKLRTLAGSTTKARERGYVNERLWECEKIAGRRPLHFSHAGQDAFLDEVFFKGKTQGIFVEIGAHDGVTGSNCLFFELMRGWSGLVVEPSPTHSPLAARVRRGACLRFAISNRSGQSEFLDIEKGLTQMGGLTASYDPEVRAQVELHPTHQGSLISVETRALAPLLEEHFLREVDYVSLDVEGAELQVLRAFPFDRFRIAAWSIDTNGRGREISAIMQANGYRRVEALGIDDIYVSKDLL